jgi:hypothetical protein
VHDGDEWLLQIQKEYRYAEENNSKNQPYQQESNVTNAVTYEPTLTTESFTATAAAVAAAS